MKSTQKWNIGYRNAGDITIITPTDPLICMRAAAVAYSSPTAVYSRLATEVHIHHTSTSSIIAVVVEKAWVITIVIRWTRNQPKMMKTIGKKDVVH